MFLSNKDKEKKKKKRQWQVIKNLHLHQQIQLPEERKYIMLLALDLWWLGL